MHSVEHHDENVTVFSSVWNKFIPQLFFFLEQPFNLCEMQMGNKVS